MKRLDILSTPVRWYLRMYIYIYSSCFNYSYLQSQRLVAFGWKNCFRWIYVYMYIRNLESLNSNQSLSQLFRALSCHITIIAVNSSAIYIIIYIYIRILIYIYCQNYTNIHAKKKNIQRIEYVHLSFISRFTLWPVKLRGFTAKTEPVWWFESHPWWIWEWYGYGLWHGFNHIKEV